MCFIMKNDSTTMERRKYNFMDSKKKNMSNCKSKSTQFSLYTLNLIT